MRTLDAFNKFILAGGAALALLAPLNSAQAFGVLHSFTNGSDGGFPEVSLIEDAAGNLYGTTEDNSGRCDCGTVFKLSSDGTFTTLYTFTGGNDGGHPRGRLIEDAGGNLYGTTIYGGGTGCSENLGCGTVFKLATDGTLTTLYAFTGKADGGNPQTGLIEDKEGNLYGTTLLGSGNVFKLAPDGTETVLYTFTGGNDGSAPNGSLIRDEAGNFFSTTEAGGVYGKGNVYKLAPNGTLTVLHSFAGGSDGWSPADGMIRDKAGNYYGTTEWGGASGDGTIFKVTQKGTEKVLYSFEGGSDGHVPYGALVADSAGNLYGTTYYGGGTGCYDNLGCGTVFKLAPDGTETVLHAFTAGRDGAAPLAGLIMDGHDHLVGQATQGGDCGLCGTMFDLKK